MINIADIDNATSLHCFARDRFEIPSFEDVETVNDSVYEFNINSRLTLSALQAELLKKLDTLGFQGFVDLYSETGERVPYYGGLGITFNPQFIDPQVHPLHQVLGSPRKNLSNFFSKPEGWTIYSKVLKAQKEKFFFYDFLNTPSEFKLKDLGPLDGDDLRYIQEFINSNSFVPFSGRNSYSDSWGFNQPTSLAEDGYLKKLLDALPFSIVRSRLAVLRPASVMDEKDFQKLWHRDEDPLLEARLIIPIVSNDEIFLEIEGPHELKRILLREGCAYSWNTKLPHRVVPVQSRIKPSVNLVLGFSPWVTIHPSQGRLEKSQYFGTKLSHLLNHNLHLDFLELKAVL